jgi:hypothetical protein
MKRKRFGLVLSLYFFSCSLAASGATDLAARLDAAAGIILGK